MRIWDLHIHPEGSRIPGKTLTEKVDSLLAVADRMGIERLGLFLNIGNDEREIEQLFARRRDRLFGFIWLTLYDKPVEANIGLMNRWIVNGPLTGIKLGGYSGIYSLPVYDPVFAHAAKLRAVTYLHTWLKVGGNPPFPGGANLPQESRPQDVAVLAARRPEVPLICGHTGGDWELGIRAVRASKNVSVEVGGGWPTRGQVEMAVKELGAERVIYGSDIPGRGFATQLAKVHGAAISEREKEMIFSENFRRLLAPICTEKGIPL